MMAHNFLSHIRPAKFVSFEKVVSLAEKEAQRWDKSLKEKLSDELNHGKAILRYPHQLTLYLAKYGRIHNAKLLKAFKHIPHTIFAENHISLIDYGCGQGIGPMVFSDFLNEKYIEGDFIDDIWLIEPSKIALSIAKTHVKSFYPFSNLHTIHNVISSKSLSKIHPKNQVCAHLFSNVIDMPEFPIDVLADYLNGDSGHTNVLIGVSPFYPKEGRGIRMSQFSNLLHLYRCHFALEKHVDEWREDYSCQIRIWTSKWI